MDTLPDMLQQQQMDALPDMPSDDLEQQMRETDKINDYKKQIIQMNQRINELNLQTNDILIPLLYESLITFFFKEVVEPKKPIKEPYITLYSAITDLIGIIQPKYKEYSANSLDAKTLLNDLMNLSLRLDYFFKLLVSENIIETKHTELIIYLEDGFRKDANTYSRLVELIDEKQSFDAEIGRLRSEIYDLQQRVIVIDEPEQLTPQQMILQQSMIAKESRANTPHLFLLVCHGSSVSQFKTYFKTRAYFKNVEYMIPFGKDLYALEGIEKLYKNINYLPGAVAGGIDKYLDINRQSLTNKHGVEYWGNEIIVSDNEYAYLPPMLFSPITHKTNNKGIVINTDEMIKAFNSVMGLYHYAYNKDDGKYYPIHVIADYNRLVETMKGTGGNSLPYSSITKLTRDYFKNVRLSKIAFDNPNVGIDINAVGKDIMDNNDTTLFERSSIVFHTCRSYLNEDEVLPDEILKLFNSTIVIRQEPTPANIITELNPADAVSLLSIDIKNFDIFETMKHWQGALAGLYNQGCGLNVISFYNLINMETAVGAAACVNIGTSMFKIADYIKNKLPISDIGVCRMPIAGYIKLIQTIINELVKYLSVYSSFAENSYFPDIVFFLRVYAENIQRGKEGVYNEVGHFISICLKDNHIYFIDPQVSVAEKIKYEASYVATNAISTFLEGMFARDTYSSFKYCDFYLYKNPVSPLKYETLVGDYGGVIRPRPLELSFGGKPKLQVKTQKKRVKRTKENETTTQKRRRIVKTQKKRTLQHHKQKRTVKSQ